MSIHRPARSLHSATIILSLLFVALIVGSDGAPVLAQGTTFTVMPATGGTVALAGEEVTFAVTSPEAGRTYTWVFGDGSPPATGTRVTHAFSAVDDFAVMLAVQSGGSPEPVATQVLRVIPELRGVFASDWDGQFTPADLIQMTIVVWAPGLSGIGVRTSGTVVGERNERYNISGSEDWLVLENMPIADERNPIIREELLRRPGASIPLENGAFTLAFDYTTPSGRQVSFGLTPPVRDFIRPERGVGITYPQIHGFAGRPPPDTEVDNFYLRGDVHFSHPDDYYVRKLALEFGRRNGPWPDDPHEVAMNIFRTIDFLFGDDDPGEFNNDYNIARLFEEGTLKRDQKNGKYICIAQTYLFTGLSRTLGFPTREINNAIGEPQVQLASGAWRVRWWQEAGAELWYNGSWHYFDTYLGVTDRQAYLANNLIYQSWAAFNQQNTEFITVRGERAGMRGHNFGVWPGDPPQWSWLGEVVRPGVVVEGMTGEPPARAITGVQDLPATVAQPPARAIASLPMSAGAGLDTVIAAGAP